MTEMVRTFDELEVEQFPWAGGKGSALARLTQAGYPVPDGFVILPDSFDDDDLKPQAWTAIQARLEQMRKVENGMAAFAVRSSALSEDSAVASFAGEFETVLDVHTNEAIRAAIHTVRHSRHSERVQVYSEARGIDSTHELAVVVQRLVRADISGVLFTANPVTGSRAEMTGNFVYGFGEELVSGEVEPYTFTLERPDGRYHGPPELRRIARRLYKLASRLEQELGNAQDIEWCVVGDKLHLLQSRPITTLIEHDPTTGEWNATLAGDYLWSNMIVGEVFPESITPSTWSVWQGLLKHLSLGDIPTIRNIAGRLYLNYSLLYSFLLKILRSRERIIGFTGDSLGTPPENRPFSGHPARSQKCPEEG
jgi:phosphoenolpyruvate synthase/pyruvate phosphate dikinase